MSAPPPTTMKTTPSPQNGCAISLPPATLHPATLTSEIFATFDPTTCVGMSSVIGSEESAAGPSLCASPAGPMIGHVGREVAPVNLSARQAKGREQATKDTSGQLGLNLSEPVDPPLSSESKSHRQPYAESPKRREHRRLYAIEHRRQHRAYQLIRHAKERAAKKGLDFDLTTYLPEIQARIDQGLCEVTGLPLNLDGGRTWDSPSLDRVNPKGPYLYSNVRVVCHAVNSAMGDWGEQKMVSLALAILAKRREKSNELSRRLAANLQANLAGRGSTLFNLTWQPHTTPSGLQFYRLAASGVRTSDSGYGSWPTPTCCSPNDQILGATSNGSPAETGSSGQLAPAFSLWLMGFPPEWDACGVAATRSSRRSRRSSSEPSQKAVRP
jgi:hypothetical protein